MTTGKLYTFASLGYIAVLASIIFLLFMPISKLQKDWQTEQLAFSEVEKAIGRVESAIGYVGFIHQFKNYVLRRDTLYLEQSLAELSVAKKHLNLLLLQINSKEQIAALNTIFSVLSDYEQKALMFYQDLDRYQAMSIHELDKLAKVNDTEAAEALHFLRRDNEARFAEMRAKTERLYSEYQYQLVIWGICTSFIYWIILFTVITLNRTLRHSLLELKVIKDLSPIALILTDNKGRILQANPAFRDMFNIPKHLNLRGSEIEIFIPDEHKENHRKHRQQFYDEGRSVAMNERQRTFFGQKLGGAKFPVEIAISTFDIDQNKVTMAIVNDKSTEHHFRQQAEVDFLTKVYNRRFVENALEQELHRFERYAQAFTVLLIDVDKFKEVNDTLGHDYGDEVLLKVVSIVESVLRKSDMLARWGGDEFICILPNTVKDDASVIAQRIVGEVATNFANAQIQTTVSIGVAEVEKGMDEHEILKAADNALYDVKGSGRNGYGVFGIKKAIS